MSRRSPDPPAKTGSLLPSPEAIARKIVEGALSVEFSPNPVCRTLMGRAFSVMQSVATRHGMAIQAMIADGLSQDDRFEVFRDHPIPVGVAALELVSSRTRADVLRYATLSSSGAVHHVATIDIFAIQLERGWAGAFDSKRGQAPTPTTRRRNIELDLRAIRMTLPSFARQMGFLQVDCATSGVIDYFGNAGFREAMTVPHADIDRLFEMQLTPRIDAMTAALEVELDAALREVLKTGTRRQLKAVDADKVGAEMARLFRVGATSAQSTKKDRAMGLDASAQDPRRASAAVGDASPFGRWWPQPEAYDPEVQGDIEDMLAAVHCPGEKRWPAAARGDAASAINLAIRVQLVREPQLRPYRDVILVALWRCAAEGDATAGLVMNWLKEHPSAQLP
jgi:hypothetical protein